jgi:hypothetical protein
VAQPARGRPQRYRASRRFQDADGSPWFGA